MSDINFSILFDLFEQIPPNVLNENPNAMAILSITSCKKGYYLEARKWGQLVLSRGIQNKELLIYVDLILHEIDFIYGYITIINGIDNNLYFQNRIPNVQNTNMNIMQNAPMFSSNANYGTARLPDVSIMPTPDYGRFPDMNIQPMPSQNAVVQPMQFISPAVMQQNAATQNSSYIANNLYSDIANDVIRPMSKPKPKSKPKSK